MAAAGAYPDRMVAAASLHGSIRKIWTTDPTGRAVNHRRHVRPRCRERDVPCQGAQIPGYLGRHEPER